MKIDVSRVVVPYRSIARMLGSLDSVDPRSYGRGGSESFVPGAPPDPTGGDGPDELPPGPSDPQREQMVSEIKVASALLAREDQTPGILYAPDNEAACLLLGFMTRKAISEDTLKEVSHGGLEAQFDDHDLTGWLGSFLGDWYERLTNKRPLVGNPNTTALPLGKNDVRIAILGDWGTNLYGAPRCAQSILDTTPLYDVVLHLGDVYYAGDTEEVKERFLDPWPRVPGARSLALNSNHEMYSGGAGYFDLTLPAFQQQSSYFAYQTDHFVLVGLDTGYDEYGLAGNQDGWLESIVSNAGDRKVVLFTHHQPYSLYESKIMRPQSRLGALLKSRKIFAWYWGHEHRCVMYDRHPAWGVFGRCIGHSGYPYFRKDLSNYPLTLVNSDGSAWRQLGASNGSPGGYILDGQNYDVAQSPTRYGPHGYASLQLSGPHLIEQILAADGTVLHQRELA
jgi:hypothetical protein